LLFNFCSSIKDGDIARVETEDGAEVLLLEAFALDVPDLVAADPQFVKFRVAALNPLVGVFVTADAE